MGLSLVLGAVLGAAGQPLPGRTLRQRKEGVLYQDANDQEEQVEHYSDEEEWEALEAGL